MTSTSATVTALDVGDLTKIGIGLTIAVVVIGFLLSLVITAIIGRLLILAVVVVVAVLFWQQRASIENKLTPQKCQLSATFFGVHLDAPDSVRQYCAQHQ